jgi:valyl-tRNA synthetase
MKSMDKQYNPSGLESKWYPKWEEAGLFQPSETDADSFVITLPPPNVTGILHIGHCLGAGIMDCLVRYYRMCGRPTLFIPGTDHASIATENKVAQALRDEGKDPKAIGREAFLERAKKWSNEHREVITDQFRRYGVSLDWTREAFTLDEERSLAVQEAFVRLYEKGWIYRADYMVNWSVAQQSAVSDEEVVHKEVRGKLWHFRYDLADEGDLIVATTRPETMLGDTAIAIHPTAEKTKHLRGREVVLPLVGRRMPVVEDEHVDPEFGTGCVKVTPAHDPNDYEMGRRHGLEFINILEPDGRLNDKVPEPYRGLDRFEARRQVVADMEAEGRLVKTEDHVHKVGYHDRTDTIIEPYISKQWFLKMEDLARPAIAAVENGTIRMFPERWIGVYYNWMRNIRDWCISRQLWWGHRIPFWECSACGHGQVQSNEPAKCSECGHDVLVQDNDVLDTWFSSWLWTFSPLGWPDDTEDLRRFHPTSVLVTGADILFFWVARMIMASYEFLDEAPFTEVLYTGIIRDEQGRKLSKSLGNSPDPLELMDRYGADALRFVLIMLTPTGQDINFSEDTVETGRNFCNKIWNATRLLWGNVEDMGIEFPPAHAAALERELGRLESETLDEWFARVYRSCFGADLPEGERGALELEDAWMLHRVVSAAQRLDKELEARRLNDAAYAGYDCFWHEFCDWYLEAIKPRLRGDADASRLTALTVALCVHNILLRMLHPFLPYITEELWSLHPATEGFIISAPMPHFGGAAPAEDQARLFGLAQEIVATVRNLRNEIGVPPGKRGQLHLQADTGRQDQLHEIAAHVEILAKMDTVVVEGRGKRPAQCVSGVVDDIDLIMPLQGLVDLEREKARLNKERDELQGRVRASRAKLSNEKFTAKAPVAVVQRERDLVVDLEETLSRLDAQLEGLKFP